ncbi:MAG: hypothetical protein MJ157_02485 [Clostridia bacterium]|nr:hypothetical protein [Clostridia bacterium]
MSLAKKLVLLGLAVLLVAWILVLVLAPGHPPQPVFVQTEFAPMEQPKPETTGTTAGQVSAPEPEVQTSQSSDLVYITASGHKYHRETCRTLTKSNPTGVSREEAIASGREACKVCNP